MRLQDAKAMNKNAIATIRVSGKKLSGDAHCCNVLKHDRSARSTIFRGAALALFSRGRCPLQVGTTAHFSFKDVDGNEHSIAGGHVTIITVVTRQNEAQAQAVADHVPDRCLGDRRYAYITLVNFQKKLFPALQGLTRTIIRNRLDAEANRLRPEYTTKHINHDPRQDMFVVADFDGKAVIAARSCARVGRRRGFCFQWTRQTGRALERCSFRRVLAKAISAAE